MKIAIIGSGNGGQAIAGFLAMTGHNVSIFSRSYQSNPREEGLTVELIGAIRGVGKVELISNNIKMVCDGAEIILVTTTADAHKEIAILLAPHLKDNQIIVLNPGRTFGALEFRTTLETYFNYQKRVIIAEAQSFVYACRAEKFGKVNIIGKKVKVLIAAFPTKDTKVVFDIMNKLFDCFIEAENVLTTSLENIGAIFHPSVVMFNAAAIERGNGFYFYNDMTPMIADFLLKLDQERINVGKKLGVHLMGIENWVSYAYPNIKGNDLCEKMRNNPAYYQILAPKEIVSRLITEDVPTGLVPISQLGDLVGVDTSIMKSIIKLTSVLANVDFMKTGRTLHSLGLMNSSISDLKNLL